ncbi:MAG: thiamine pyrophosphate-binding protein [Promethearchaeota archaeon]
MEEKQKLTGGDVLIKALLEENVRYMFGIIGGQFLSMFDAIFRWGREKGIETVMFRHESAAAHAADAWARVTNKPGVCFGTVGPGATNLVPGVGAAWSDNIPIVAIVPQVNKQWADSFTLQGNLDQITMFRPISKYQKSVIRIEDLPDAVRKIFREAVSGRPRPVLLEIQEDVFTSEIEEDKLKFLPSEKYRPMSKPAADPELVKQTLNILLKAKKPLILCGGGVNRAEAWSELKEFVEYLQIPVITSVMGIGAITNESNCLIGATLAGPALKIVSEADVILALGTKFEYTIGHGVEPFWKDSQTLIQVDIDPTMIGRAKPLTLGIVSDCKLFLKQILEETKKVKRVQKSEWLEEYITVRNGLRESMIKKTSKDKVPIIPQQLIKEVLENIEDDAILVLDGGDIICYVMEQIDYYKPRKPLSTLQAVSMGQLGTAVPYGIGAKLAKPEKQVVAIAGDGSFMINIQDLETAVRLGLKNLIYVIANNNAWGMLKSGQKLFCSKHYLDVDLPKFDYAKLAEAFGCYGEIVVDPNEIKPALERAKNSEKPAVLDVKIAWTTPDGTKLLGSMGVL